MSQKIVRAGLEKTLATWAASQTPALGIAFENMEFTPPDGPYLRAFLLPVPTQSKTIERTDRVYGGIFQIDLVMPINFGPAPAETLLASLMSAFTPSAVISESGQRINILQPASAAPALPEPNRHVVPVSVAYEMTVY